MDRVQGVDIDEIVDEGADGWHNRDGCGWVGSETADDNDRNGGDVDVEGRDWLVEGDDDEVGDVEDSENYLQE